MATDGKVLRRVRPANANRGAPQRGDVFSVHDARIHFERAEALYDRWPAPTCIISDGPYGVSGFPGDQHRAESLADWYAPHAAAWSQCSTPQTTLWFWNTEVGWATVHPLLLASGWEYRSCHVWDKGLGHVAGNANTKTLRKFPVVTEVCVQYVKAPQFRIDGRPATMQDWLRHEWRRSGLPLALANAACGVHNAATRKYLTADHLWYYPPVAAFVRLARYANEHGRQAGRPYFSLDGKRPLSAKRWARMRAKFHCDVGVTNVWRVPQVAGGERIQGERGGMKHKFRSLHGSQKPLALIERCILACSDKSDVVWEPFGGLCPGGVVALKTSRAYRAAEIVPEFFAAAAERMASYERDGRRRASR